MRIKKIVTAMMAGCATVVISAAPGLAAQTSHEQHATTATAKPAVGMEAKCQAMMADMQAADARLNGLVATMNNASGTDKVTATATVVTEMATQRRTMRDGMMKMEQDMMRHMMEHMQAGKDSMANCPMMKQMGDSKH